MPLLYIFFVCCLTILVLSIMVLVSDDLWMTYDDLKSTTVCQYKSSFPVIDPGEVHIVMWRSRPVRSTTLRSHSVPYMRSSAVPAPATSIICAPQTAPAMLIPAANIPSVSRNQLLRAHKNTENQPRQPSTAFSIWSPVIASTLTPKVLFAFC